MLCLCMHACTDQRQQLAAYMQKRMVFGGSAPCMPVVQYAANGSNRGQVVAEFQAALEPLRATLREFPWLGGSEGPDYADMYVMGFFVVSAFLHRDLSTHLSAVTL